MPAGAAAASRANLDRTGCTPWNKGMTGGQGGEPARKGHVSLVEEHRECLMCGGWLPFRAFAASRRKVGGVASTCKQCVADSRRVREDELWRQVVVLMGGRCADCGYRKRGALGLRPLTDWAVAFRTTGPGSRGPVMCQTVLAQGADVAGEHWRLECANCEKVRVRGRFRCPR